jgi:hypothetical protein
MVTGGPDGQAGTWFAPHRRQKRAVADKGSPQFTQDWTPDSGRLSTSRLDAAQIASTALTRPPRCSSAGQLGAADGWPADQLGAADGWPAGQRGVDGHSGSVAGGEATGSAACGRAGG